MTTKRLLDTACLVSLGVVAVGLVEFMAAMLSMGDADCAHVAGHPGLFVCFPRTAVHCAPRVYREPLGLAVCPATALYSRAYLAGIVIAAVGHAHVTWQLMCVCALGGIITAVVARAVLSQACSPDAATSHQAIANTATFVTVIAIVLYGIYPSFLAISLARVFGEFIAFPIAECVKYYHHHHHRQFDDRVAAPDGEEEGEDDDDNEGEKASQFERPLLPAGDALSQPGYHACIACDANPAIVTHIPCMHTVFCVECARRWARACRDPHGPCVACRRMVESFVTPLYMESQRIDVPQLTA